MKLPIFDERSYLKQELRGALFTVLCVVLALAMAAVAGLLTWATKDGRIAFILGILGFFLIRMVLKVLNIDTKDFDKMRWAGGFFSYFLTFIAIWILLINPPLVDLVPPKITERTAPEQELGAIIAIGAIVDDNQGVKFVQVIITDPFGHETGPFKMDRYVNTEYRYVIANPVEGRYNYTIEVRDQGGFFVDANYHLHVLKNVAPTIKPYDINYNGTVLRGIDLQFQVQDNVGVILAFYGLDQRTNFETYPGSPEAKLTINKNNPKDSIVVIHTKIWDAGPHNVTVCAMDRVPHRETCNSYKLNML